MTITSTTYLAVIILSGLSFLTAWAGVALALRLRENPSTISAGMGFAAGIMILISLMELLPASYVSLGPATMLLAAVLGAVLVWTIHLIIPHTHLLEGKSVIEQRLIKSSYLVVFGLILHDVPEGFALANAYVASPDLGVLVALVVALHNVPEEFAMAVPAVTIQSRRFLYTAALLSATAEPIGAVVGLVAVTVLPDLNPLFMALAAGVMLFVSFHEVIPMARHYRCPKPLMGGIILSVFTYTFLAAITVN